ncbi:syntaxin-6 [Hyalella azteca]|uniref:Syntaxin-6 n=1 Tax=Hyalella azteca TaxID=294128 RepID=A0A8B7P499_HYAAZ|nr:syntaxin-6 [Hyalella azteca]
MTLEDPFFVVKDEVSKALSKTRTLFQRWQKLNCAAETSSRVSGGSFSSGSSLLVGTPVTPKEELDWTSTELRNSLHSIEWDLEDLEETISIVEKNPKKFRIDLAELKTRHSFILQTREEVKSMNSQLLAAADKNSDYETEVCLANECEVEITTKNSPTALQKIASTAMANSAKYSRLVNQADESPSHVNANGRGFSQQQAILQQQQAVMAQQDEQLEELASSMSVLKQMSRQVGQEVDEQAVMLDEFGHEMEHTQSKMDNTLNKIAKVMHLTNDRRQWAAIGILSAVLIVLIILFFVL